MTKEELAKSKFHGVEKYNCAQAVLAAFQHESGMSDEDIASYSSAGGGRVEGGTCGALYAARILVSDDETLEQLGEAFCAEAGSTGCREIRKLGKLPCKDCVGLAARIVAQTLS